MAKCRRLLDCCVKSAKRRPDGEVREAFDLLFGLLRHVDEGHDDVVFFADEGGSYEVGVDWKAVLPGDFAALAGTSTPGEYAGAARSVIKDFVDYDHVRYLKAARAAASSAQKNALREG